MNKLKKSMKSFLLDIIFIDDKINKEVDALKNQKEKFMKMSTEEFNSEIVAIVLKRIKVSIITAIFSGIFLLLFYAFGFGLFGAIFTLKKMKIIKYSIIILILSACLCSVCTYWFFNWEKEGRKMDFLSEIKCLRDKE